MAGRLRYAAGYLYTQTRDAVETEKATLGGLSVPITLGPEQGSWGNPMSGTTTHMMRHPREGFNPPWVQLSDSIPTLVST